jgi:YbbR domain-containing protein
MNAKIVLTVPMEKVPHKISELLENVSNDLEDVQIKISDMAVSISREQDLLNQLNKIDKCRKELALLDSTLEDCYSVIIGMINYKTKLLEEEQRKIKNGEQNTNEG